MSMNPLHNVCFCYSDCEACLLYVTISVVCGAASVRWLGLHVSL